MYRSLWERPVRIGYRSWVLSAVFKSNLPIHSSYP